MHNHVKKKKVIIIGAGPAGLAAAYQLSRVPEYEIIIVEHLSQPGGLARTLSHNGFRFDLGPHRFFTKDADVSAFWEIIMPLQGKPTSEDVLWGKQVVLSATPGAPDPEQVDRVMLSKHRFTRMFFYKKFFHYPITLSLETIKNLGFPTAIAIGLSYLRARLVPRSPERNLEDFYVNRFGKKLYSLFFESYTEKVWGRPCQEINKEWGSQRVKGLSLSKMLKESLNTIFNMTSQSINTSLIESFLYPKYGAGQFYETLASDLERAGVKIWYDHTVISLHHIEGKITEVTVRSDSKKHLEFSGVDAVVSTMPIKDLISALHAPVFSEVAVTAKELPYRNSIIVAMSYKKLAVDNNSEIRTRANIIPDNWIYIQESSAHLGRISIINNFSEFMLKDPNLPLLSLEYFCNDEDKMWTERENEILRFAQRELHNLGIAETQYFISGIVVKVEKSYPAYFGVYNQFHVVRNYLDEFVNLFPAGRNGQHRYNNMDHSIASGFAAARAILDETTDKQMLWAINTDTEYHEGRTMS